MRLQSLAAEPFHELRYYTSGPRHLGPQAQALPFFRATAPRDELGGWEALILASDLQGRDQRHEGRLLGVALAEELALLAELEELPPLARSPILLAGDLFDHATLHKRGGTGPVGPVYDALAAHAPAVVGVMGNHDLLDGHTLPDNAHILDGDDVWLEGLRVAGVGGILGKLSRPNRKTERDFFRFYRALMKRGPDVLLSHLGPNASGDRRGDPDLRSLIERQGPADTLFAFGHCHWHDPLDDARGRQLLNLDARVVVVTPA